MTAEEHFPAANWIVHANCEDMMVNQEVIRSEHLLSKGDSHLYK